MTTCYEVRDYWITIDDAGTYANFTGIVSDMVMVAPATRYEPEQWGDALCDGHIMLADDDTPPAEDDEVAIFDLANAVTNWELSDPTPDY